MLIFMFLEYHVLENLFPQNKVACVFFHMCLAYVVFDGSQIIWKVHLWIILLFRAEFT
jgi:hypothetical protein